MQANLKKHPELKGAYIAYDANGFAFRVTINNRGLYAAPDHVFSNEDRRTFSLPLFTFGTPSMLARDEASKLESIAQMIDASSMPHNLMMKAHGLHVEA